MRGRVADSRIKDLGKLDLPKELREVEPDCRTSLAQRLLVRAQIHVFESVNGFRKVSQW